MGKTKDRIQMISDKYNNALDKELKKHKFSLDEKLAFTLGVQFQMDRSQKMMESIGK